MARHVRKGDLVEIISGKHKGLKGKILEVLVEAGRVRVEGVNSIKHVKANPTTGTPGGRLERLGSVHISNVLPVDPESGRGTRVGWTIDPSGAKSRIAKRSGRMIA